MECAVPLRKAKPDPRLSNQVLGPPEHEITSLKKINRSLEDIYDVFSGATEPRYSAWVWADVRDVARAHVAAMVCPLSAVLASPYASLG